MHIRLLLYTIYKVFEVSESFYREENDMLNLFPFCFIIHGIFKISRNF